MTSKNVDKKVEHAPNPNDSTQFVWILGKFFAWNVDSENSWHVLGEKNYVQILPSF